MSSKDKLLINFALRYLECKLQEGYELHPDVQRATGMMCSQYEARLRELPKEVSRINGLVLSL
jgi:hypothetical protein